MAYGRFSSNLAVPPPAPPLEKADPKQMALPLPDLPSIAVLPFVNRVEDPNNSSCAMVLQTILSMRFQ